MFADRIRAEIRMGAAPVPSELVFQGNAFAVVAARIVAIMPAGFPVGLVPLGLVAVQGDAFALQAVPVHNAENLTVAEVFVLV
jgi:hypothetical protein